VLEFTKFLFLKTTNKKEAANPTAAKTIKAKENPSTNPKTLIKSLALFATSSTLASLHSFELET